MDGIFDGSSVYLQVLIRWAKKAKNHLAFLHLACAIITCWVMLHGSEHAVVGFSIWDAANYMTVTKSSFVIPRSVASTRMELHSGDSPPTDDNLPAHG